MLIVLEKKRQIDALENQDAATYVAFCNYLDELTYLELPIGEQLEPLQEHCKTQLKETFADDPKSILYFLESTYEDFDEKFDRVVEKGFLGWSVEDRQALYYMGARRLEDASKSIAYAVVVKPENHTYWVYDKVVEHYLGKYPQQVPQHYLKSLWKLAESEYQKELYFKDYYTLNDETVELFQAELAKEDNTLSPLIKMQLYTTSNDASKIAETIEESESRYQLGETLSVLIKNPPDMLATSDRVKYYKQWVDDSWSNDLLLTEWFELAKASNYEIVMPPAKSLLLTSAALLALFFCPLLIIIPVHYVGLVREKRRFFSTPIYPNITLLSFLVILGGTLMGDVLLSQLVSDINVFAAYFDPYATDVTEKNIAQLMLYSTAFTFCLGLLVVNTKLFGLLHPTHRPHFAKSAVLTMLCVAICFGSATLIQAELLSNTVVITEYIQAVIEKYGLWTSLLVIAVLGPVFEEILCRGVILNSSQRHLGFWFANALQACVFMFLHIDSQLYLYYFIFGSVAGVLYRYSKTLYAPIIMHIIINTIAVLALHSTLPVKTEIPEGVEAGSALANCMDYEADKAYDNFLDCNLAAEQGHVAAINQSANFVFSQYMPGDHIEYALGILWKAEENADRYTHYLLSRIYRAQGEFKDEALSLDHLKKSAEAGLPSAQSDYAGELLFSQFVTDPKDIAYAVQILESAIETGFNPARNQLAWYYATTGNSKYRDGPKAVEIMEEISSTDLPYAWIDTLAAAYASVNNFEQAIERQNEAIEKAQALGANAESISGLQQALEKYTRGEAIQSTQY